MKSLFLTLLLCATVITQSQQSLTNQDVINLVKSGLSAEVVTAKIKRSGGTFDTSPSALKQLKDEGVPESVILAMIETQSSNSGTSAPERAVRVTDELTTRFKQHQSSVVTVWSEFGHGTGFIVDQSGLVMTNQHVVGPSESIAIQFDERRKIPAVLLAADAEKDVAVLWANLDALPDATVAPLAKTDGSEPQVVEGERVFTIGSPLSQRKIMTSGIVNKIEPRAIISDININPGNSGGPLFNSLGQVVGLTTFSEQSASGPGISGIVRLEEALPVLEQAKTNTTGKSKPDSILLPVEPAGEFPLDAIKASLQTEKLDTRPYIFSVGNYDVALITPILKFHLSESGRIAASKEKEKRNKKQGAAQGTFRPWIICVTGQSTVGNTNQSL